MKRFVLATMLFAALMSAATSFAAPRETEMTLEELSALIATGGGDQSVEELNAALREQVLATLKLAAEKRSELEPIYDEYRKALKDAVVIVVDQDRDSQEALDTHLQNIKAAAEVKQRYLSRFAKVLSPEQIRILFEAEGELASNARTKSAERRAKRLKEESAAVVTRELGKVGDYRTLVVGNSIHVVVKPDIDKVRVTLHEYLVDCVQMSESNGVLELKYNVTSKTKKEFSRLYKQSNFSAWIEIPVSAVLEKVTLGSYSTFKSEESPLRGNDVELAIGSFSRADVDVRTKQNVTLVLNSYAKYKGNLYCRKADISVGTFAAVGSHVMADDHCTMKIGSYSNWRGDIRTSTADMVADGFSKYIGDVTATTADIRVGSYASIVGAVTTHKDALLSLGAFGEVMSAVSAGTDATVEMVSYAKFGGSVAATGRVNLSMNTYSSFSASVKCEELVADMVAYTKTRISSFEDAGAISKATVTVGYQSNYLAPKLEVANYDIRSVGAYARLDVNCTERLDVSELPSTARINLTGDCQVNAMPSQIVRQK